MNILALDTSTEFLSLALDVAGEIRVREMLAGQKHSSLILPLLRELLDEAGVSLRQVEGIAFGQGPGSFTGLRIGCGIAQGLAFGTSLPVVGIGTLMAMAQATDAQRVIACLDARMGEVYHAAYERTQGSWREIHAPGLYHPSAVPDVTGDGWYGVGSGWDSYETILRDKYQGQLDGVQLQTFPLARHMLAPALTMFEAGQTSSADSISPVYVRNKVALTSSERG
jgi:tRNA threonylcarbamoyladenosine biosynthesis protein TsaB